jgi:hypothetical protein
MKKPEKPQRLYFTTTEKNLLIELTATAPVVLVALHKLIKAGNGEMNFKDFSKIINLIFLLTEFTKRAIIKPENASTQEDISDKDL